tara:strand:+ start:456 stop:617 length:162 start_codon:yes stop_codon:yes gene_type:complete
VKYPKQGRQTSENLDTTAFRLGRRELGVALLEMVTSFKGKRKVLREGGLGGFA